MREELRLNLRPQAITVPSAWMGGQLPWESRQFDLLRLLIAARLRAWIDGRFLGLWWWLFEPLAMTLVYLGFVEIALDSARQHVALFLMSAVLPWTWFTAATGQAARALTQNAGLLKSSNVPYELFPAAEVAAATIRFLFSLVLLVALIVYYGIDPAWSILSMPLLILVQFVFTLGVSYWLAWAQVYVEDTVQAWQVVCRAWFFLSPSIYALECVPESWQWLYLLNPFAALFSSYRNVLLHGAAPCWCHVFLTLLIGSALWWSGRVFLQRARGTIALQL